MAFRDLREFVAFVERRGQLRRISSPVSCDLEITEIADRVVKAGGPALLFENVISPEGRRYGVPVLINAFGTADRMSWALGLEHLDQLADRLAPVLDLVRGPIPTGFRDQLKTLWDLRPLAASTPKVVTKAPCQEVVRLADATLEELPILKCWPRDGGRFITLPLVISRDPATSKRNVGMYRMQVYDGQTTGMHWHRHKDGAGHYREGERTGQRLEIAVALGGDPATIYSATAPLPAGLDEFLAAGVLRGSPVELVRCKTIDLEVPAEAEYVLEGFVDPGERRLEGPFGDHTGFYSQADDYPVFHITAITHRAQPIYPATVVGRPIQEDYFFGKATERLFLPVIKVAMPEVVDMNMPAEGGFHNLVIVSIKNEYPGQAQRVMSGLWGLGQMMLAKNIVILDADANVQDVSEVAWRVLNNVDPRRDIMMVDGPLDALDHAAPRAWVGSKAGIDATRKTARDGYTRDWPDDITMSDAIRALVDEKWLSYGI